MYSEFYYGKNVPDAFRSCAQELIALYMSLFNAKGRHEWGEKWTYESTKDHLEEVLHEEEGRIPFLCLLYAESDVGRRLIGFSLGAYIMYASSFRRYGLPDAEKEGFDQKMTEALESMIVSGFKFPVCCCTDFGIMREYRKGFEPIARIFIPSLGKGSEIGCKTVFGWSAAGKKSFMIFLAFGGKVIMHLGGRKDISFFSLNLRRILVLMPVARYLHQIFFRMNLLLRGVRGIRD